VARTQAFVSPPPAAAAGAAPAPATSLSPAPAPRPAPPPPFLAEQSGGGRCHGGVEEHEEGRISGSHRWRGARASGPGEVECADRGEYTAGEAWWQCRTRGERRAERSIEMLPALAPCGCLHRKSCIRRPRIAGDVVQCLLEIMFRVSVLEIE
jgi:hypothetical protein